MRRHVFVSVRDRDKADIVPLARKLLELGFSIYATRGTSTVLQESGIPTQALFKICEGRPNVLDMIEDKRVRWVINTPSSGTAPRMDEVRMRARAVIRGIPITTTIDGLSAAINGLTEWRAGARLEVCSLQEYHRRAPKLNLEGFKLEG